MWMEDTRSSHALWPKVLKGKQMPVSRQHVKNACWQVTLRRVLLLRSNNLDDLGSVRVRGGIILLRIEFRAVLPPNQSPVELSRY
jgi:hypothetical protein